jgi:hypothetical protein
VLRLLVGGSGCDSVADVSERALSLICDDGIDNDIDGLIDFPQDTDCNGPEGISESLIAPIPSLQLWSLVVLAGLIAAAAGRARRGVRA